MQEVGKSSLDQVIGEWLRFRYTWQRDIQKDVDDHLRNRRAKEGERRENIDVSVLLPPQSSSAVVDYTDPDQNRIRRELFSLVFSGSAPQLRQLETRNLWSRVILDTKEIESLEIPPIPTAFGGPRTFPQLVEYAKNRYRSEHASEFESYKRMVLEKKKIDGPLIVMEWLPSKPRPILLESDGLVLAFVLMDGLEGGEKLQIAIGPYC